MNNCVFIKIYFLRCFNFRIFNITDVTSPQDVANIQGNIAKSHIIGNTMYCIGGFGDVQIYNIVNPAAPQTIANYPRKKIWAQVGISVHKNYILVGEGNRLMILDASNFNNLNEIGSYVTSSYFSDMIFD